MKKQNNKTLTLRLGIINALSFVYKLLRPILGPKSCRFTPTCSEYA
ncbi:MAG: membrane protein insertion efficiency factor YidD, partial [Elusimicrobia bacterium]|nr:membrane protein insertion efficiency factor YidD [Elusimicrobiota bacterium]